MCMCVYAYDRVVRCVCESFLCVRISRLVFLPLSDTEKRMESDTKQGEKMMVVSQPLMETSHQTELKGLVLFRAWWRRPVSRLRRQRGFRN